ncbi:MAG: anti-sigma factor antagonist [Alphaproteobacteria bacterium]|nr:anti-sigma factor antagonist [Alphaproteobacteria bacterium]
MSLEITEKDGATIVALAGDVDLQTSPAVRQGLLECLETHDKVVVDMSQVNYIDSSGVASLVEAFQVSRKKGSFFALAHVSAAAMRVLNLARLDKVFSIHESTEDALAANG